MSKDERTLYFPKASLDRLKIYRRLLTETDSEYISSEDIANKLGINPELVRKDLSYINYKGKPKVGYHVQSLLDELNELFGLKKTTNVIIVGAGHLGRALANFKGFSKYGIKIVGIFDNDPQKINQFVGELVVLPLDYINRVVRRFNVEIGTICVPEEAAQKIADLLVQNGIKAIWNFAPVKLEVSEDIIVVDEDISQSLLTIKHLLERKQLEKAGEK
ncbi:MAG: redox-sensing transcriptional repressor [Thermotogaceae bacterium]|jgi:redox-sensing transcriptional repressor|nr:redox-sensing transcriptional repressor [Thermotogaceae bacterium]MDN5338650.1 redox-sensing transcriptional repressor [Thermotogaceae bacterium]